MSRRSIGALIALSGAVVMAVAVGVASAAGPEIPRGPSIDFCPTTEQIEAHLDKFGFDYKPTVTCGENGEEVTVSGSPVDTVKSNEEIRQALLTARRAPDTDGDPLTMEIVLADGSKATIEITGDPSLFKDLTPAQLANGDFTSDEGRST